VSADPKLITEVLQPLQPGKLSPTVPIRCDKTAQLAEGSTPLVIAWAEFLLTLWGAQCMCTFRPTIF